MVYKQCSLFTYWIWESAHFLVMAKNVYKWKVDQYLQGEKNTLFFMLWFVKCFTNQVSLKLQFMDRHKWIVWPVTDYIFIMTHKLLLYSLRIASIDPNTNPLLNIYTLCSAVASWVHVQSKNCVSLRAWNSCFLVLALYILLYVWLCDQSKLKIQVDLREKRRMSWKQNKINRSGGFINISWSTLFFKAFKAVKPILTWKWKLE